MKNRITTGHFNPRMKCMTVMVCPDTGCSHVWEASNTGRPCPVCGNTNVVPASNWNLDGTEVLKLGKLPADLPKKANGFQLKRGWRHE
ncbi:MAG: hypothetical protein MI862_26575 [Desulfobacterales bacterium]|nr:hypothetical protein [Desulfobacterales bacterium]